MRGIFVYGLLFFTALRAVGQDAPGTVELLDGGFASIHGGFHVTFEFSNMAIPTRVPQPGPRTIHPPGWALVPEGQWSGASGAKAQVELCCLKQQVGLSEIILAVARIRLNNPTDHPFNTTLAVAIGPEGAIHALAFEKHAFFREGRPVLVADTPSRGAILAESPFASRPLTPQDQAHVESVKGECRGEMFYDLVLAPGRTQTLGFICPLLLPSGVEPNLDFYRGLSVDDLFAQAQKAAASR